MPYQRSLDFFIFLLFAKFNLKSNISGMTSPPAATASSIGGLTSSMGQMNVGAQPGMMPQQPMGKNVLIPSGFM